MPGDEVQTRLCSTMAVGMTVVTDRPELSTGPSTTAGLAKTRGANAMIAVVGRSPRDMANPGTRGLRHDCLSGRDLPLPCYGVDAP